MKVTIHSDGDRIVRYGVGDFQVNADHTVTLFYGSETAQTTTAPHEETIEGELTAAVDSAADADLEYRLDDLDFERAAADDLVDHRPA